MTVDWVNKGATSIAETLGLAADDPYTVSSSPLVDRQDN